MSACINVDASSMAEPVWQVGIQSPAQGNRSAKNVKVRKFWKVFGSTHLVCRFFASQTPEKHEAHLERHRVSGAKYRAANRAELRHKEWKRRPGYDTLTNLTMPF